MDNNNDSMGENIPKWFIVLYNTKTVDENGYRFFSFVLLTMPEGTSNKISKIHNNGTYEVWSQFNWTHYKATVRNSVNYIIIII